MVNDLFVELLQEIGMEATLRKEELDLITDFAHKSRSKGCLNFAREIPQGNLSIKYDVEDILQATIVSKSTSEKSINLTTEHYFQDENLLHLTSLPYRQKEITRIAEKIKKFVADR